MRKPIPGILNVFISDVCELTYFDGERCNFPINDDNIVEIPLYGNLYKLSLQFLMLYAWFEMPSFISINNIYFISLKTPRKLFPWKAMFKNPYYYDCNKIFRIIPSFPLFVISADGICINITKHSIIRQHIGKTGYAYVNVYNPLTQRWKHAEVHQLVASAWIDYNQNSNNIAVNHIDGNKLNNNANNLEWCTLEYNAIDGVKRSMKQKEWVGKTRDINTGEIKEFKTFTELNEFLNIKSHNSEHFKNSRVNKIYNKKYEVRLNNDNRPWFYANEQIVNQISSRYVITVTEPDNTVLVFNGLQKFKEHYGFIKGKLKIDDIVNIFK